MSQELKPCPNPWCVHQNPKRVLSQNYMEVGHAIRCECGVIGPQATSANEAIEAWNNRGDSHQLCERLRAIETLCSEEITTRFGGHAHKSEDELGRNSRVYALLVMPRNMAREAIRVYENRGTERKPDERSA